jgi:hypothetical protein
LWGVGFEFDSNKKPWKTNSFFLEHDICFCKATTCNRIPHHVALMLMKLVRMLLTPKHLKWPPSDLLFKVGLLGVKHEKLDTFECWAGTMLESPNTRTGLLWKLFEKFNIYWRTLASACSNMASLTFLNIIKLGLKPPWYYGSSWDLYWPKTSIESTNILSIVFLPFFSFLFLLSCLFFNCCLLQLKSNIPCSSPHHGTSGDLDDDELSF